MPDASPEPSSPSPETTKPATSLRTVFPGYYPPTAEQLRQFVVEGLVVLDTNSLLDVYRFTERARTEYLAALTALGERLWIPHRVGTEFFDNRVKVMRARHREREQFGTALHTAIRTPIELVTDYTKDHGLSAEVAEALTAILDNAVHTLLDELDSTDDTGSANPDIDPSADPILAEVEAVIGNRIGLGFDPQTRAGLERISQTRFNARIPPGWADQKKGERAIGDYLIWEETIRQAKTRKRPVLMITNENKPDWTRHNGEALGPRPELVKEMFDQAAQGFHLVDVHTFLALANEHLAAKVSETTVTEATRLVSAEDSIVFGDEAAPTATFRVAARPGSLVDTANKLQLMEQSGLLAAVEQAQRNLQTPAFLDTMKEIRRRNEEVMRNAQMHPDLTRFIRNLDIG
ncbi:PIN-like domain-containing protein [Nocardia sp. NPDC058518]|uniref:PIN-like domain-containing protein n=1 Tax=Nocardia sp. NPDC058518 TaxID=3346534 RepID=UPI003649CDFB